MLPKYSIKQKGFCLSVIILGGLLNNNNMNSTCNCWFLSICKWQPCKVHPISQGRTFCKQCSYLKCSSWSTLRIHCSLLSEVFQRSLSPTVVCLFLSKVGIYAQQHPFLLSGMFSELNYSLRPFASKPPSSASPFMFVSLEEWCLDVPCLIPALSLFTVCFPLPIQSNIYSRLSTNIR